MKISQKRFKALLNCFVAILILFLFVSCSLENAIIGKWSEIGGTETLEFFKDGTVVVVEFGMSMVGSYKFIDKDQIKLELGGLGVLVGPMVAKISIKGDEMTLNVPTVGLTKYKRVK